MIFKIIGAAAAAANLLLEFNTPEKKEAKLTNIKKGKVILVNSTTKLNFSILSVNPGAIRYTKYGVNISTKITINKSVIIKAFNTSSANFLPSLLLSDFAEM